MKHKALENNLDRPTAGPSSFVTLLLARYDSPEMQYSREYVAVVPSCVLWKFSLSVPGVRDRDRVSESGELVLVSISPFRISQLVFS